MQRLTKEFAKETVISDKAGICTQCHCEIMHLYSLCIVFEKFLWSAAKTVFSELNFSSSYV